MSQFNRKTRFISDGGGKLDIVSAEGELLAAVTVPAGIVSALPYAALVPAGGRLEVAEGLAVYEPPHRVGIQRYGEGSHDSGANPDYRPTASSRLEREMRQMLSRVQASEKRQLAREKALARIERVPDAPAEVIETPAPAPVEEKPEVAKTDGQ